MTQSPDRDGPLLQLQKVDSSQAGARELSPIFSGPPPAALPSLDSQPICIPSPYTELGHDFGALPFYGSGLVGYGGPSIADCPPMRQSLSPTLFWSPSTHHGHVSPLPVHRPQSRLGQHGGPTHGAWAELTEENRKPVGKRGLCEDRAQAGGKADMHFCAVCSDYASGYHYGVWSCEGCKAFFKRSIQGHNDYICPATNQCTIDKNRRKSCQACRLRKCYEVGMMKCGMRRDRSTYNRCSSGQPRRMPRLVTRPSSNGQRREVAAEENEGLHQTAAMPAARDRSDGTLTPEQLIARILEAEPPDIYLMKDMKKPFTEANVMMSLTNLADKELVHMISWAKKIPGFVELGLLDQVHLLECCWLEVLMLGLMWRSVDQPGKLIFSPDLVLTRDDSSCVQGFMEIFDMLLAATARFRELRLQKEEYVCLKAMILLNSNMCLSASDGGDGEEFQSHSKLLQLLDGVTDALVWAIAKGGGSFQQQSTRLAHLLMLLSHIRHLSNKGMDHLHCMKMKKMVPVYDLLLEMLDAHVMHSSRLPVPLAQDPPAPLTRNPIRPPGPLSCPRTHWPHPGVGDYRDPSEFALKTDLS
ncbi:estrogen receptor 2a isoform X1 [Alosa sapidissima]|uniref:estrogen receptor 2a isoform X1 n=1 Tax=Alosa sapidissima TaxID=34773 RepID=UPI001C089B55|nr:estrogen receptor 2a isoform X1 [Alosa sapidissima]XP_041951732.1 estrogen receptor 2a isoform X1 [Alosa sapidissima]XP_041951733.1 estrogen receptor 2a isoform X1 [Alosa sapidissima]